MFDTARAAVEAALAGGAVYADARVVSSRTRGAAGAERRDRGRRSQRGGRRGGAGPGRFLVGLRRHQ